MRWSTYIIKAKIPGSRTAVLYNPLTGTQVFIEGDGEPDEEMREFFLREGFMTEMAESQEYELVRNYIYRELPLTRATIILTTSCNFRCVYCFQEGEKWQVMSKDTARKTAKFIVERARKMGHRRVQVVFSGGEPLMNMGAMRIIATSIKREFSGEFEAGVITNGYYLTDDVVKEFPHLNVKWVKVTLDGLYDWHDRLRLSRRKGERTFFRIVEGIKRASQYTKVIIASNYIPESLESVRRLIDYMDGSGLKEHVSLFYARPVFGKLLCESDGDFYSFSESSINTLLHINSYAKEKGFQTRDLLHLGPCAFYKMGSVGISPDGGVFPCDGFVHFPEYRTGDVFYGEDLDATEKIKKSDRFRGCRSCSFLPVCGGGCAVIAVAKTGSVHDVLCEKKYFEISAGEILKDLDSGIQKTEREVRA